jgi:hypothetical protein
MCWGVSPVTPPWWLTTPCCASCRSE